MSRREEIFEKFDCRAFTFDLATHRVQVLGGKTNYPAQSLLRAMAPYCRESRSSLAARLRAGDEEGSLLLLNKHEIPGSTMRTELSWRFERETGQVVGLLRTLSFNSLLSMAEQNARLEGGQEPVQTDLLKQGATQSQLHGSTLPSIGVSTAKERLVQLNIALNGAQLGYWDWNKDSGMLLVNAQWGKMLGIRFEEVQRVEHFFDRLHPEDRVNVDQALARYSQGRMPMYRAQFRLLHAQGHYVHIEAVGAFQLKRTVLGRKEMHLVGIHRDRSDDVDREMYLKRLIAQANEVTQAKSQFLANISHEIRTPVHGLLNLMQLVKGFPVTEKQRGYLDAAIDTTRALGFKLDGLVDFATLETTPLLPKQAKGRLMPLFDLVERYCWKGLSEKNLRFNSDIDPRLDAVYDLD